VVIEPDRARDVEVKAVETVRAEDFRGLRHLAYRFGDRFRPYP
jgi:hypothetical protein